jgi:hypothetical protein
LVEKQFWLQLTPSRLSEGPKQVSEPESHRGGSWRRRRGLMRLVPGAAAARLASVQAMVARGMRNCMVAFRGRKAS